MPKQKRFGDDRGMTLIFVGLGMVAFMSATMLALDVGNLMVARTQAQSSADAGALAGVTALVFDDFNNRASNGPAVQNAIVASTSSKNQVIKVNVSVLPADVTFPGVDKVRVAVRRTTSRGNPVNTFLGPMIGIPTVDVGAIATAQAAPANAETCLKPFTIPDKWREVTNGPWTPNSTFDIVDNKGKPLANPDVYIGPSDATNYTGYDMNRDKGLELILKANNSSKVTSSFYNPWDLPGSVGGADYRNNIATCNPAKAIIGQTVPPENGNMVGPTAQGTQDLINQDPGAYWDTSCKCVKGSAYGRSPRVVVIPVYNPVVFVNGPQHGKNIDLQITNFIGFFIEPMNGGQVMGRITPVAGLVDGNAGPVPAGAFPKSIRLIE